MASALSMISRAVRLIHAGPGAGQTLPPEESSDGLTALNAMLDAWINEKLMVYQILQRSLTWPAATASRTIGSGGDFNVARPVRIESAIVTVSSVDYPIEVVYDRTKFDSIPDKTQQSTIPDLVFYDPAYPLGTLYLFYVPSAGLTLKIAVRQVLQSFAVLADSLSLPPGYEDAITFNLAVRLAPEYEKPVPPAVAALASQTKASIKSINAFTPRMLTDIPMRSRPRNVYTDQ